MDNSELAVLMLDWEKKSKELEDLEQRIKDEVMDLKKTVNAGNVRASYYSPRKTFAYQEAGMKCPYEIIQRNTMYPAPVVDWKKVCDEALARVEIAHLSEPSVTIKRIA